MSKIEAKKKAIELRKQGWSYSEILSEVPATKSTLSLWLKDVGLSRTQVHRLTEKKLSAALRGAAKRKKQRIIVSDQIKRAAIKEIGKIDKSAFWLIGAALYWAEGGKQKEHNVAVGVIFANSDPVMKSYFYKWLIQFCGVPIEDIYFELYVHSETILDEAKYFWSKILKKPVKYFSAVRIKKGNHKSFRKNKGSDYHGLLRIKVRRSTYLNRRIMGWVEGFCRQF